MGEPLGDPPAADPLPAARLALERGEYGRVLRLLEPLAEAHGPATALGAGVRLLMATALMGQGDSERAAACCRALQASPDAALRARARDLLAVLEAPVLRRPRDWSLTLPDLSGGPGFEAVAPTAARRTRRDEPPPPPPPPVGATRPPGGFAALVVALLVALLLASLLGGCMELRTELRFEGPGRLQVGHALQASSTGPTPWQRRFAAAVEPWRFQVVHPRDPLELRTPVLPAQQALTSLAASLEQAASLAGLQLPPPTLALQERNWLVGVQQRLTIALDLSDVPDLAGLSLRWRLSPLAVSAVRLAEPLPVRPADAADAPRTDQVGAGRREAVLWPLAPGRLNRLEVAVWRWSPLGLGGVLIALVLLLVLVLQRQWLRLGFGPPGLPS
jgi:hypothetical protein